MENDLNIPAANDQAAAEPQAHTAPEPQPEPDKPARGHMKYVLQAEKQLQAKQSAASKQDAQTQPPKSGTNSPAEPPTAKPADPAPKTATEPLTAPKNWPESDKQAFAALPDEGKKILLRIEKDLLSGFNKKMKSADSYKQEVGQFLSAVAPFVNGRFKNMDEFAGYLQGMRNFESQMQQNPLRTLAQLAAQRGVDLLELAQYTPDPTEETLAPLREEMQAIRQLLSARQAPPPPKPVQPASDDDSQDPIAQFAAAAGSDGALLHPHFKEVAHLMGAIMRRDGHEDLEKAYAQAIMTLPQVQEQNLQSQKAAWQAERQKSDEVAKAKRAQELRTRSTAGQFVSVGKKRKNPLDYIMEAEQQLADK